jgi:Leucine-rich repeat (LRR) protein
MYNKFSLLFCRLTINFLITGSFLVAGSFLVMGCKNYSVNVNENVVYTPPSIFKGYQITDTKLRDCVEQTIFDQHITKAEDLTRLNCSNAGIASLAGLETFFALKELNLTNNKVTDINTIGQLGRLEKLMLGNNKIRNASPLLHLLHLKQLDVKENPQMECKDLKQLARNLTDQKTEITLPGQCR